MEKSSRLLFRLLFYCGVIWSPCCGINDGVARLRQKLHGTMVVNCGLGYPEITVDRVHQLLASSEPLSSRSREDGGRRGLGNGSSCLQAWRKLQRVQDTTNTSVAARMLDATGKPGAGILDGNVYAYGSFQECTDTGVSQYCIVPLNVTSRTNATVLYMRLGVCMPKECTAQDISDAIEALDNILHVQTLDLEVDLQIPDPASIVCQSEQNAPYRPGAIAMIALSSLLVLLALVGSLFDCLLSVYGKQDTHVSSISTNREEDLQEKGIESSDRIPLLYTRELRTGENPLEKWEKYFDLLTAFSLYKTVSTVLSTDQPPATITCINAIRVISMFWVILFHVFVWPFDFGGFDNMLWITRNVPPRFSFQAVINGTLAVDSFFLLSGLLASYLTLRQMSKRRHWKVFSLYYVHRVIRLTPTYAFVLFFYWFVSVHFQPSPVYTVSLSPGGHWYETCRSYWWTNLLYINNLHPWGLTDECMEWTWYLANDMQFFVLAPLMIVLLFWSLPLGLVSVAVFLCGSFIATGVIAGYYDFAAGMLSRYVIALSAPTSQGANPVDEIYTKPYTRISPYLVGILLGFIFYHKFKISASRRLNLVIYALIWGLAALLCLSALYGEYGTWHGRPFNKAENVLFFMFQRFAWAVGVALLVFACHSGYGGAINRFLSMKLWVPLSRLTFCAYLVHPIVVVAVYGADVTPIHYTDVTVSVYAVGIVVLSYGVAGLVAVFVEFPVANLEAAVLRLLGVRGRESARLATRERPRHSLR